MNKTNDNHMHTQIRLSIHVGIPSLFTRSANGDFRFCPVVFNGLPSSMYLRLLYEDGRPLQEWRDLPVAPYCLRRENGTFVLLTENGETIPSQVLDANGMSEIEKMVVLRCHVKDTEHDGCWHASHAALLLTDDATAYLEKKISSLVDYHFGCFPELSPFLPGTTVRIVARNIVVGDAVSNFALGLAGMMHAAGYNVALYAHDNCPAYAGIVAPIGLLPKEMRSADILVYNYSIADDFFTSLLSLPWRRRLLYFHHVTPGSWFAPYDVAFASRLDAACEQFPYFRQFDAVLANSRYTLRSIASFLDAGTPTLAHPPCFSLSRLEGMEALPLPTARFHLLWVGRIAPHKRPDLALRIFDALIGSGVDASLTLVGGGRYDFPKFAAHVDACLASLAPVTRGRVRFLQDLSDGQLAYLYRNASLLLCTSAHEGYCMPVAEAGALGLPVAATPQPAVLETLNGGGLILSEEPDEAARELRRFLLEADEAARRRAVPVLRPLPTDELLRLIRGEE